MPTYITGGPARVTITPLRPLGPVGIVVILVLGGSLAARYAHTIMQAVYIIVAVTFGGVVAAFVTMAVLLTRRILTELRPIKRSAPAVPAARSAGQLRRRAAPAIAPPPPADIDAKPEWIIPREASR